MSIRVDLMHVAPLLPAALGLIFGIYLDSTWPLNEGWYWGFISFACLLMLWPSVRVHASIPLVFLAAACCGGLLHFARIRAVPLDSIERRATETGRIVRIRGRVASPSYRIAPPDHAFARWVFSSGKSTFLLDVQSVEAESGVVPASGRIRVTAPDRLPDTHEDEDVEIFGRLYMLQRPQNPGSVDWGAYLRRQGIVATLRCEHTQSVLRLSDPPMDFFPRFLVWFRTTARGLLVDDLVAGAPEEASLLEAMVLGHRSQLDRRLNDIFIRAGCIHFLAASGTNVVILIGFVWLFARLFRCRKAVCAAWMLAAVVLYALLAEPRPPILRATVMVAVTCIGYFLGRPSSHLNCLAFASLVLLLIRPSDCFDVGAALSVSAVAGVTGLGGALIRASAEIRSFVQRRLFGNSTADEDREIKRALLAADRSPIGIIKRWFLYGLKSVGTALAFCFGAWLAGLPIGLHHFQRLQPWGAVSSALVFPLFSSAMFLGFLKLVVTAFSPTLGAVVNIPLGLIDSWILWSVEQLAALPAASVAVPPLSGCFKIVYSFYYAALILFGLRFRPVAPSREDHQATQLRWAYAEPAHPRWLLPACVTSAAGATLGAILWLWPVPPPDRLAATVLAVGRGSAVVLELPNGQSVLYDAGTSQSWGAGRSVLAPFLVHRGVRRLERVYISHANLDHFSGLPSLLEEIPAGPVVLNHFFDRYCPPNSASRELLNILAHRGHPVQLLDNGQRRWVQGDVVFELLWPPDELKVNWSANDTSTVVRVTFAETSILLTGDIEEKAIQFLLQSGNLRADILLLPHHGSVTPSLRAFLDAVQPRAVIRSHYETLEQTFNGLQEIVGPIPLYNTADHGAIEIRITKEGRQILPYRPAPALGTKFTP